MKWRFFAKCRSQSSFLAYPTNPVASIHEPDYDLYNWLWGAAVKGVAMLCSSCHSGKLREYNAEINVHFPGMKGLNIPTVWVFPQLLVCLDCGQAQFTIPDAERKTLIERDFRRRADEAAV